MRLVYMVAFLPACALHVNAGGVVQKPFGSAAGPAAMLEMRSYVGDRIGLGIDARSIAGADGIGVSAGPELCMINSQDEGISSLCLGAAMVEFDDHGSGLSLATMSPTLEPTFGFTLGEESLNTLFVSLPIGYENRRDGPDAWFCGVTVGFGWHASSDHL